MTDPLAVPWVENPLRVLHVPLEVVQSLRERPEVLVKVCLFLKKAYHLALHADHTGDEEASKEINKAVEFVANSFYTETAINQYLSELSRKDRQRREEQQLPPSVKLQLEELTRRVMTLQKQNADKIAQAVSKQERIIHTQWIMQHLGFDREYSNTLSLMASILPAFVTFQEGRHQRVRYVAADCNFYDSVKSGSLSTRSPDQIVVDSITCEAENKIAAGLLTRSRIELAVCNAAIEYLDNLLSGSEQGERELHELLRTKHSSMPEMVFPDTQVKASAYGIYETRRELAKDPKEVQDKRGIVRLDDLRARARRKLFALHEKKSRLSLLEKKSIAANVLSTKEQIDKIGESFCKQGYDSPCTRVVGSLPSIQGVEEKSLTRLRRGILPQEILDYLPQLEPTLKAGNQLVIASRINQDRDGCLNVQVQVIGPITKIEKLHDAVVRTAIKKGYR